MSLQRNLEILLREQSRRTKSRIKRRLQKKKGCKNRGTERERGRGKRERGREREMKRRTGEKREIEKERRATKRRQEEKWKHKWSQRDYDLKLFKKKSSTSYLRKKKLALRA